MTLTLTLANVDRLDNNSSTHLTLDRHGASIGRSPNADWTLPDPKNYISYSHCDIVYRGGNYLLIDKSTNGTYVNNSRERVAGEYPLADGDELTIGHYRIVVSLDDPGAERQPPEKAPARGWGWDEAVDVARPQPTGWEDLDAERKPAPAWQFERSGAEISGTGAMRGNFTPPRPVEPAAQPGADIWSRYAESNKVDWGSFESPAPAQQGAWSPAQPASPWSAPAAGNAWTADAQPGPNAWQSPQQPVPGSDWPSPPQPAPAAEWASPPLRERVDVGAGAPWPGATAPVAAETAHPNTRPREVSRPPQPEPASRGPLAAGADAAWNALLSAAGLSPADVKTPPAQAAAAAGTVLRRLVAGLVVMLEARARAKAELGATSTTIELAGNNPLKFTRDPASAVARLLNPPERGFMDAGRAVEDAFKDLQAHQMATLTAMQGALRATLQRFSPEAIRARAEQGGLLSRLLPGGRDSELWEAYECEFEGVVQGSDEAFMDTFAKAFRDAYQKACAEMKAK